MDKKTSISYIILVSILIIFLIILLVLINNGFINTKLVQESVDKATQNISIPITTVSPEKITIKVNDIDAEVIIDTYPSFLGFSINYDSVNMKVDNLSDSSVIFYDNKNKNNYYKITKLSESEYNNKYELFINNNFSDTEEEGNSYNYEFYSLGKNEYKFLVIECVDTSDEYNDYFKSLYKYMSSTLEEH